MGMHHLGRPVGVELALHLYRNDITGTPNLIDSDVTHEDGSLEVTRGGIWGSNDGNLYFVEVEVLSGYNCGASYTLTVGNDE